MKELGVKSEFTFENDYYLRFHVIEPDLDKWHKVYSYMTFYHGDVVVSDQQYDLEALQTHGCVSVGREQLVYRFPLSDPNLIDKVASQLLKNAINRLLSTREDFMRRINAVDTHLGNIARKNPGLLQPVNLTVT